MKKIITILLALVLVVSAFTFVACDNHEHNYGADGKCVECGVEHEHTYEDTWTKNTTHHWHKATCELVDGVKDKAEHNYGADKKCTVCGIDKPVEYTVTAEKWAEILTLANDTDYSANIYMSMGNPATQQQNISFTKDGKLARIAISGTIPPSTVDEFLGDAILDETDAQNIVAYEKKTEDGAFELSASATGIKEEIDMYDSVIKAFVVAINGKFTDATFDTASNKYKLTVDGVSVPSLPSLNGVSYEVSIQDGEVVTVLVEITMQVAPTMEQYMKFNIVFDGWGVELPTVA